jgi:hypothetical protein
MIKATTHNNNKKGIWRITWITGNNILNFWTHERAQTHILAPYECISKYTYIIDDVKIDQSF